VKTKLPPRSMSLFRTSQEETAVRRGGTGPNRPGLFSRSGERGHRHRERQGVYRAIVRRGVFYGVAVVEPAPLVGVEPPEPIHGRRRGASSQGPRRRKTVFLIDAGNKVNPAAGSILLWRVGRKGAEAAPRVGLQRRRHISEEDGKLSEVQRGLPVTGKPLVSWDRGRSRSTASRSSILLRRVREQALEDAEATLRKV